ncbi:MAG: hypothetical protein WC547_06265 [Candidatus Omnitrophota bacterium]
MVRRIAIAECFVIFVFSYAFAQQSEKLTITTYYPSPTGVYQTLRVAPSANPGDCVAGSPPLGKMYYNDTENSLYICTSNATSGTFGYELVPGGNGAWAVNGDKLYVLNTTMNVSIGTITPESKFHVHEPTPLGSIAGDYQILETISGKAPALFKNKLWLYRDQTGSTWNTARLHDGISIGLLYGVPGVDTRVWWERDPNNNTQSWGNAADTYMTINDGDVGIGTTAPATKLHLARGEVGIGQAGDPTPYLRMGLDNSYWAYLGANAYFNTTTSAYNYVNLGGYGGIASRIALRPDINAASIETASGGTNPISWVKRLVVLGGVAANAGNVGIGTTNPVAKLEVNGDTRFGCRTGFWGVGDGRLCVESTLRGPSDAHTAIGTCKSVAPGCRVCTHTDMQQACGAGFAPYGASRGWYGDHGVASGGNWDDEYGTWNSASCGNNNDGSAYEATSYSYNFRCCY